MGSWCLDAFLGPKVAALDLDEVAAACNRLTGEPFGAVSDVYHPFSNQKHGVRIDWLGWWVILLFIEESEVAEYALQLSKSRAPPASVRKRLPGCTVALRAIFAHDETRDFTNHMIEIWSYLSRISDERVYDSKRRTFWTQEL